MKKWEDENIKNKVTNKISVSDNYKDEILDTRIAVSNIFEEVRTQKIHIINNLQPNIPSPECI